MHNLKIENSLNLFFGNNCVEEYLYTQLKKYKGNVMIVYEQKNAAVEHITSMIGKKRKIISVFLEDKIAVYESVFEVLEKYGDEEIGLILAIGKEASIQFAKALSLFFKNRMDWNTLVKNQGIIKHEIMPYGIIATTVHSSDATNGRIEIFSSKFHTIWNCDYSGLSPAFALLDPNTTGYQSKIETITDGMMILTELMENYFSRPDDNLVENQMLRILCKEVVQNLRGLYKGDNNIDIRANLMRISMLSEYKLIKFGYRLNDGLVQMACQVNEVTHANYKDIVIALSKKYFYQVFRESKEYKNFIKEVFEENVLSVDQAIEVYTKLLKELSIDFSLDAIGLSKASKDKFSDFYLVSRCRCKSSKMTQICTYIE